MQRQVARPAQWSPARWSPTRRRSGTPLRPWLVLTVFSLAIAVSTILVSHSWLNASTHRPVTVTRSVEGLAEPLSLADTVLGQGSPDTPGHGLGWHHATKKSRTPAKAGQRTLRTQHFLTLLAVLSVALLIGSAAFRARQTSDTRSACLRCTASHFLRAPPAATA